jgi:putative lipoprotein
MRALLRPVLAASLLALLAGCASPRYQPHYLNGQLALKQPLSLPLATTLVRVRLVDDSHFCFSQPAALSPAASVVP